MSEKILFIENFVSFCHKNNIWYAIDSKTLLSTYHHQNFSKMDNNFQIMMTVSSYQKLKRLASKNIVDSFVDKNFKSFKAFYVKNIDSKEKALPFIEIRLIIPTTLKKVRSFTRYSKFFIEKIKRIDSNINYAVDYLYEQNYDGYFLLDSRFKNLNKSWILTLNLETTPINFAHFKVESLKNSKMLLEHWFGSNLEKI